MLHLNAEFSSLIVFIRILCVCLQFRDVKINQVSSIYRNVVQFRNQDFQLSRKCLQLFTRVSEARRLQTLNETMTTMVNLIQR
uniref:Secreted protein n=1 Tax=Ascaris lumbricoides TaxID=6252 RepID=A0A0M3I0E3_ASCLU